MVDAAAYEFADTEAFIRTGEEIVGDYIWGRYDLLVLPPSFPYGGRHTVRKTTRNHSRAIISFSTIFVCPLPPSLLLSPCHRSAVVAWYLLVRLSLKSSLLLIFRQTNSGKAKSFSLSPLGKKEWRTPV